MYSKKNDYFYFKKQVGERISIREFNQNDENELFLLFSNPNVTKHLSFYEYTDISQARNLIERAINQYKNEEIFYLGITDNKDDKVIGYIGLSRYDLTVETCQIVYALSENYWGMGIMVEAVKLFNNYLFNNLKKTVIIATHLKENVNSGRVMVKAGMVRDHEYDMIIEIKGKKEKLVGYTIKKEKK